MGHKLKINLIDLNIDIVKKKKTLPEQLNIKKKQLDIYQIINEGIYQITCKKWSKNTSTKLPEI